MILWFSGKAPRPSRVWDPISSCPHVPPSAPWPTALQPPGHLAASHLRAFARAVPAPRSSFAQTHTSFESLPSIPDTCISPLAPPAPPDDSAIPSLGRPLGVRGTRCELCRAGAWRGARGRSRDLPRAWAEVPPPPPCRPLGGPRSLGHVLMDAPQRARAGGRPSDVP